MEQLRAAAWPGSAPETEASGGCVVAAGGLDTSTAEVLDVAEGKWRHVPSAELPNARYNTGFALVPR